MSILLVLEESGGKIKRASWEALAAALRLGPAESIDRGCDRRADRSAGR